MWQVIVGIIQLIYLFMQKKFERDEALEKRKQELAKQKEALYVEAKDAIKSGDAGIISGMVDKLRK